MYGMRFAQIAQDMCNYLDAQTKDLAPNEALVAKKMIIAVGAPSPPAADG